MMTDYRCDLCWEEFDTPADLLAHEEAEEETIYVLDGSLDEGR